jgi:hypothetical protein
VTVARRRVDHRHGRDVLQGRLQSLAAARYQQVHDPLLRGQLGQLPTPTTGDQADAAAGQPGGDRRLGGDRCEHRIGLRGARGAAQHDRVAGLQAQRGGVDRHVRARLVDDGDDSERDAHLAHVQAVGQALAVDHLADRVAERGHGFGRSRYPLQALGVQAQTVEQSGTDVCLATGLQVELVGREDLLLARAQRRRDRLQGGVLGRGVARGERSRRAAGARADFRDR